VCSATASDVYSSDLLKNESCSSLSFSCSSVSSYSAAAASVSESSSSQSQPEVARGIISSAALLPTVIDAPEEKMGLGALFAKVELII
jgi:hypothetical protein